MKYKITITKEDKKILDQINDKGISDYELSKMVGYSYPYINMLRNGKAVASFECYTKILNILNG